MNDKERNCGGLSFIKFRYIECRLVIFSIGVYEIKIVVAWTKILLDANLAYRLQN